MLIALLILTIVHGQYDSYYDADGDLIPIEDLQPTQLVTTEDLVPNQLVTTEDPPSQNAKGESKFIFWELKLYWK